MTNAYPTLLVSTAVDAEVNVYQWLRDADIAVIRPAPNDGWSYTTVVLAVYEGDTVRCVCLDYRDGDGLYPEDFNGLWASTDRVWRETYREFVDDTLLELGCIVTTDWRECEAYLNARPSGVGGHRRALAQLQSTHTP